MMRFKLAAILAAGAALALSPAPACAQAEARPVSLGVRIEVQPQGPVIVEILPDRTAAAMGFQVGDILLEAGGRPISPEVLRDYWEQRQVGDQVSFKVQRAGAVVELTGTAMAAPAGAPAPPAQPTQ